jgi:hypothetical protein
MISSKRRAVVIGALHGPRQNHQASDLHMNTSRVSRPGRENTGADGNDCWSREHAGRTGVGRHSDVLEIARGGATVHLVTDPILTGFRVVLGLATALEPRAFRSGTT